MLKWKEVATKFLQPEGDIFICSAVRRLGGTLAVPSKHFQAIGAEELYRADLKKPSIRWTLGVILGFVDRVHRYTLKTHDHNVYCDIITPRLGRFYGPDPIESAKLICLNHLQEKTMNNNKMNPGPSNVDLIANIAKSDVVTFVDDDTRYVFQDKQSHGGNLWFKPEDCDRGFTLPPALVKTMRVKLWERALKRHHYLIDVTETRHINAYNEAEVRQLFEKGGRRGVKIVEDYGEIE